MQRAAYLLLLSTLMFANGAQLSGHHARVVSKLQKVQANIQSHPAFKLQADAECTAKTVTCAALGAACDDSAFDSGATELIVCDFNTGTCEADAPPAQTMSCKAWVQPGAACTKDEDCRIKPDTSNLFDNSEWICYDSKCTDKATIPIPAGCRNVGDMCSADADCVTGLKCSGGKCDGPKAAGQPCSTTEFATLCATGLMCYSATGPNPVCTMPLSYGASATTVEQALLCPIPGYTVNNKCAKMELYNVAAGGACMDDVFCKRGLYCANGACATETNVSAVGAACNSSAMDPCGSPQNNINELNCVCDAAGGSTKCTSFIDPCLDSYLNAISDMSMGSSCGQLTVTNGIPTTCVMPAAYLAAGLQYNSGWSGACDNQLPPCAAAAGMECYGNQYIKTITMLLPSNVCGVKIPSSVTMECSSAAGVFPAVSIVAALGALLALIR